MQAILERERMRADRSRSSFAFLTLTMPNRTSASQFDVLAQIVSERIRITDDAGLMDKREIGIVLPETPVAGAWKLAEDICKLLPADVTRPECGVYAHPTDPTDFGGPSDPDDTVVDTPRKRERVAAPRAPRPVSTLFVRPLPLWKRAIDVLGASVGLLLAGPLMLIVAMVIKLTSPGPAFFAQDRDGLGGKKFRLYKFRSMVTNAESLKDGLRSKSEQDGPAFKLKNDPRVTPLGRLLRRTCVDELPQLFNVLRGDMSIVGPRPLPCNEARQCNGWERRRFDVTPGLTCIWQVYGGAKVTFAEWMRMDLRYARSRGLWKDVRLMALTVPSIIRRDGVY